ncbi:MAG: integrase core domain-containing protein [Xanthobacteraceae bacterium]
MRASTSSAGEAPIDLIISVSTRPYRSCRFPAVGRSRRALLSPTSAWRRDYNEERPHSTIGNKSADCAHRWISGTRPALIEMAWKSRQPGPRMGSSSMTPGPYSSVDEILG